MNSIPHSRVSHATREPSLSPASLAAQSLLAAIERPDIRAALLAAKETKRGYDYHAYLYDDAPETVAKQNYVGKGRQMLEAIAQDSAVDAGQARDLLFSIREALAIYTSHFKPLDTLATDPAPVLIQPRNGAHAYYVLAQDMRYPEKQHPRGGVEPPTDYVPYHIKEAPRYLNTEQREHVDRMANDVRELTARVLSGKRTNGFEVS